MPEQTRDASNVTEPGQRHGILHVQCPSGNSLGESVTDEGALRFSKNDKMFSFSRSLRADIFIDCRGIGQKTRTQSIKWALT